jgi:hypothetical protein
MNTRTKTAATGAQTGRLTRLMLFTVVLSAVSGVLVTLFVMAYPDHKFHLMVALLSLTLLALIAVAKYDFMVSVAFLSFSLVQVEPAPIDLLVALLLPIGLLFRKLSVRPLARSSLVHLALWGFLLANLVSVVQVEEALFQSLRYLFITTYMIAVAFFTKMYITSYRAMRTAMIGYLISALLAVALSVLGYLGIGTSLFIKYGTRAQGFFKDTNVFGPFLVPVIVFLIDEIQHPCMLRRFHLAKYLGVIALTAGVFLSGSRAAWANLIVSLTIYAILTTRRAGRTDPLDVRESPGPRPRKIPASAWAGLLGLLAAFIFVSTNLDFVQAFVDERLKLLQTYDYFRFARQTEGLQVGIRRLFGVGPGMWEDAHSLYVRAFAEHGIFGFVALLLLIGTLAIGLFRRALKEPSKSFGLSPKVLFAVLAGQLLNSIVIDSVHWRHLWFLLALSWVVISPEISPAKNDPGSHSLEEVIVQ